MIPMTCWSTLPAGNEQAFADFFRHYSKLVFSFLYGYTDDTQLAEDQVQDIFTKLWLTRESLPAVGNFGAYLAVIVRHHAVNVLQKRPRDREREMAWQKMKSDGDPTREPLLDLIDRAVAQLPEQQQKTWVLSRRENLKYAEIATALGISRETVKTYLHLANAGIAKYVLANADLTALLLLLKML